MRMRAVRSLVLACISIVGCLVILSTLTNTTPASPAALHTLVTHTHNHLNHLHNNIKEEFESFVVAPDPELMQKIGFIDHPVVYPNTNWTNLTTPVIVSAISSSDVSAVAGLIGVASQICPSATLLLYTLDISQSQMTKVEALCNDTCSVVPFDSSQYPSHVRNWKLQAYRPIIIQELLVRAGAVLWLDPAVRLVPYGSLTPALTNSSSNHPTVDHDFSLSLSHLMSSNTGDVYDNHSLNHMRLKSNPSGNTKSKTGSKSYESSFTDGQDGGSNSSGSLHPMYPADQASLLNLDNRFIGSKNDSGEPSNGTDASAFSKISMKSNPSNIKKKRAIHYKPSTKLLGNKSIYNKKDKIGKSSLYADDPVEEEETIIKNTSNYGTMRLQIQTPFNAVGKQLGTSQHVQTTNNKVDSGASSVVGVRTSDVATAPITSKSNVNSSNNTEDISSLHLPLNELEDCLLADWYKLAGAHKGVLTWQMTDPKISHLPTSALTHSDMFVAMQTPRHLYDFNRMSDSGAILLQNTELVHKKLMKPWLTCSLTHHCVQPIGSQDTGCRYDKKPLFRYSGCHMYDTSVFNVALGLMFGPHSHPYHLDSPSFTRTPPTPSSAVGYGQQDIANVFRFQHVPHNTSASSDEPRQLPLHHHTDQQTQSHRSHANSSAAVGSAAMRDQNSARLTAASIRREH